MESWSLAASLHPPRRSSRPRRIWSSERPATGLGVCSLGTEHTASEWQTHPAAGPSDGWRHKVRESEAWSSPLLGGKEPHACGLSQTIPHPPIQADSGKDTWVPRVVQHYICFWGNTRISRALNSTSYHIVLQGWSPGTNATGPQKIHTNFQGIKGIFSITVEIQEAWTVQEACAPTNIKQKKKILTSLLKRHYSSTQCDF